MTLLAWGRGSNASGRSAYSPHFLSSASAADPPASTPKVSTTTFNVNTSLSPYMKRTRSHSSPFLQPPPPKRISCLTPTSTWPFRTMSRRGHRSASRASPLDVQPDDFETLVQMHQRYPEDVVSRASRRAMREGRRRSRQSTHQKGSTLADNVLELSDVSGGSAAAMEFGALSTTSSPHLAYAENPRYSAASTSSSYSGAGESSQAFAYLAPPSTGRLRNRPSEATIEPLSGRDDSSDPSRGDYQEGSDGEERPRLRRGETQKNYTCTYCNKDFGGKSDWKRHETTFHEPQYTWQCPICNRSFNSKRKFSTHHGRDHNCDGCDHATEAQKALRPKAAFGCGFQSCNQVLYTWDERCNHVAKHFEDGEIKQNWQYSTMIKNLLRQEQLDGPWRSLLAEMHGRRENWPYLAWRQEDTRDLREALEYADFSNIPELLQRIYQAGVANATSRPDMPGMISPALPSAAGSVVVNPYADNESLARQSQLHAMGIVAATMSPGHPALGAEMYPEAQHYFQTQTMTPPGDVVPATAYGLQAAQQGQMYQQIPYAGQPGFQSPYHLEHPQPYPPVPPGNILQSDAYYSPRPYQQTQRPSLPPQPQSAPPGRGESPQSRRRSLSQAHSLGKRMFGGSSRKSSVSSSRARSEAPLHSPSDSLDDVYLPTPYLPDNFF